MNIALLNTRVTFQKNEVVADAIGNRKTVWTDYYTCHATVGNEGGREKYVAGTAVEDYDIAFTIRWCKKAEEIDAGHFRVLFKNELYDIVSVDHMNYLKESLKFRCRKVRR